MPPTSTILAPSGRAWDLLKEKADRIESGNVTDGWAYIISGGVALGISIPGYFLTEDVFARAVYSLGETLGVASIGYGSYLVAVENDYTSFRRILGRTALTPRQRDELAYRFLEESARHARAVRKIRVITHSLTAGLNGLNAFTTDNRELRSALLFLGGINILATIHFLFSESEEETFLRRVAGTERGWDLSVGPSSAIALRYRF
jgi:hypothetical protein